MADQQGNQLDSIPQMEQQPQQRVDAQQQAQVQDAQPIAKKLEKQKNEKKKQGEHKSTESQNTLDSGSHSKSKSSQSSRSLQPLDHDPIHVSDVDEPDVTSPMGNLSNRASTQNLQSLSSFDNALDASMALDSQIESTLQRSRRASPRKSKS